MIITLTAKIGHMLGKMFLIHTGRFTPFALSWKVLSGLIVWFYSYLGDITNRYRAETWAAALIQFPRYTQL